MSSDDIWEQRLRDSLRAQAVGPPPRADFADAVLRRGRRQRRRRAVAGFAAVALATGLATTGLWQHWAAESAQFHAVTSWDDHADPMGPDQPTPVRLAADEQLADVLRVDVVGAGASGGMVLATRDGDLHDLGRLRDVRAAHALPSGWAVISGEPGRLRLTWHPAPPAEPPAVADQRGAGQSADTGPETDAAGASGADPEARPGGRSHAPVAGADVIAVAGQRVAWQWGRTLASAVLTHEGALADRTLASGPADGQIAGLAGDAVLLRREISGEPVAWDVWTPDQGDYRPGWSVEVVEVLGVRGNTAVGLVTDPGHPDRLCLADLRLDPGLPAERLLCAGAEQLRLGGAAALGPAGRWLVFTTVDGPVTVDLAWWRGRDPEPDSAAAALVDLPAVVALPEVAGLSAVHWPDRDPDRLLLVGESGLVEVPFGSEHPAVHAAERVDLMGAAPVIARR